MRLKKADRESLRAAMPGDVLTVAGASRNEVFSIHWSNTGEWVLFHGTVVARAPDRVTERIMEAVRGTAAEITDQLDRLGAEFPLPEQVSGATDFPPPRDIYWRYCLDQLPGEHLEGPEYERRVAYSLVRARTGWRVLCMEEQEEERLEAGDYLNAIYSGEDPDIRELRSWRGAPVGNRSGIIADEDIESILRSIGVNLRTVSSLPDDEDDESIQESFWRTFEMAQKLAQADDGGTSVPKPLAVEVIGLESPPQERIERSRTTR